MTGSGNDFVFFDARSEPAGVLEKPPALDAVCDRRRGVGADGVVFLENAEGLAFGIRYFNRDGSLAELCGNASLCSVSLARHLGIVGEGVDFEFGTSSGPLRGRITEQGPEIDSTRVADLDAGFNVSREPGEIRMGFARVGVPHLVVLCEDVEAVDVVRRGRVLRHLEQLDHGANVNFVARRGASWAMRTYERGVEDETLACGTGAVATAELLRAWNLAGAGAVLISRSGAPLTVRLADGALTSAPRLRGEGRLVFEGTLAEIPGLN